MTASNPLQPQPGRPSVAALARLHGRREAGASGRPRRRRRLNRPVRNDVDPAPFPTVTAAAAALGCDRKYIYAAMYRGHRFLRRLWWYADRRRPAGKRAVLSDVPGESWPSAWAAARDLGVSASTVLRRLDDGCPCGGRVLRRGPDWRRGRSGRFADTRRAA